jgi:solute carrier family 13 (sodium-dependent dicarboxylate transporter), member 2/3/5
MTKITETKKNKESSSADDCPEPSNNESKKSSTGKRWSEYLGIPLAIVVFAVLYFMPTPAGLTLAGQYSLACFAFAFVLWVLEPIPEYVTSLILMVMLVLLGVRSEENVLSALGLGVIWLNIAAFILSSVLVKTNLARRLALLFVLKCGHNIYTICLAFVFLQLVLALFIPSSAARTLIALPIMLMVADMFGSTSQNPNNAGKNIFLINQQAISMSGSGFLTGSAANLIAVAFIIGMTSHRVYYSEWLIGSLPVVLATLLASWFIGPHLFFRVKKGNIKPNKGSGVEGIAKELKKMGRITAMEIHGAIIFAIVLFFWMTDKYQAQWFGFEISPVIAAIIGAIIAFMPKIGLIKWKEANIPWEVLIFSAGAYAGGLALEGTGAARWMVGYMLDAFNIKPGVNFWLVYIIVMAVTVYSHIVFTSKTMRCLILIPIIIALAQKLGFNPVALALPAAFAIDWVISLPINSKPNVILYSSGQFSVFNSLVYGVAVSTVGIIFLVLAGFTLYRIMGIVTY